MEVIERIEVTQTDRRMCHKQTDGYEIGGGDGTDEPRQTEGWRERTVE